MKKISKKVSKRNEVFVFIAHVNFIIHLACFMLVRTSNSLISDEGYVCSLTVVIARNLGYQDIQAWFMSSAF